MPVNRANNVASKHATVLVWPAKRDRGMPFMSSYEDLEDDVALAHFLHFGLAKELVVVDSTHRNFVAEVFL